jgi:hypothetical protein
VKDARLLENEKIAFSSCDVLFPESSLSCGTGGQVRHLRVKRPNVAHRPAPRKASNLKRKSTASKSNKAFKNDWSFYFILQNLFLSGYKNRSTKFRIF